MSLNSSKTKCRKRSRSPPIIFFHGFNDVSEMKTVASSFRRQQTEKNRNLFQGHPQTMKPQTALQKRRLRDVREIESDFVELEHRRKLAEEKAAARNLFRRKRNATDDLNIDDGETPNIDVSAFMLFKPVGAASAVSAANRAAAAAAAASSGRASASPAQNLSNTMGRTSGANVIDDRPIHETTTAVFLRDAVPRFPLPPRSANWVRASAPKPSAAAPVAAVATKTTTTTTNRRRSSLAVPSCVEPHSYIKKEDDHLAELSASSTTASDNVSAAASNATQSSASDPDTEQNFGGEEDKMASSSSIGCRTQPASSSREQQRQQQQQQRPVSAPVQRASRSSSSAVAAAVSPPPSSSFRQSDRDPSKQRKPLFPDPLTGAKSAAFRRAMAENEKELAASSQGMSLFRRASSATLQQQLLREQQQQQQLQKSSNPMMVMMMQGGATGGGGGNTTPGPPLTSPLSRDEPGGASVYDLLSDHAINSASAASGFFDEDDMLLLDDWDGSASVSRNWFSKKAALPPRMVLLQQPHPSAPKKGARSASVGSSSNNHLHFATMAATSITDNKRRSPVRFVDENDQQQQSNNSLQDVFLGTSGPLPSPRDGFSPQSASVGTVPLTQHRQRASTANALDDLHAVAATFASAASSPVTKPLQAGKQHLRPPVTSLEVLRAQREGKRLLEQQRRDLEHKRKLDSALLGASSLDEAALEKRATFNMQRFEAAMPSAAAPKVFAVEVADDNSASSSSPSSKQKKVLGAIDEHGKPGLAAVALSSLLRDAALPPPSSSRRSPSRQLMHAETRDEREQRLAGIILYGHDGSATTSAAIDNNNKKNSKTGGDDEGCDTPRVDELRRFQHGGGDGTSSTLRSHSWFGGAKPAFAAQHGGWAQRDIAGAPDWLFKARHRLIRNKMATEPQLDKNGKRVQHLDDTNAVPRLDTVINSSNTNKSDFYLCVRLVRTRTLHQSSSVASWIFNAEIVEQRFPGDANLELADHRHTFTGLQCDPEAFIMFHRYSSSEARTTGAGAAREGRPGNGRVLSPFDDLPWLRGKPLSYLHGKQLRVIVAVVYPIRETVIDSSVQF